MRRLSALVAAVGLMLAGAAPALANVHWIEYSVADRWNSIRDGIVNPYNGPTARLGVALPNLPAGTNSAKYTVILTSSMFSSGPDLASKVVAKLADANADVVINEISDNATLNSYIAQAAGIIGPGYANRWGVYIAYPGPTVNDPCNATGRQPCYPLYSSTIDAVFANNGRLLPELYPNYQEYWTGGGTDALRDDALVSRYFNGAGKINWLAARKSVAPHQNSTSRIQPVFSAGDVLASGATEANFARFVDRVLFVYVAKSGYRAFALRSNGGGAGSYKWASTGDFGQVGLNTRDNWFANLWVRYAETGLTSPNWPGPMPAP